MVKIGFNSKIKTLTFRKENVAVLIGVPLAVLDQVAGLEVFRFDEEIAVRPADHAEIGELELCVHHPEYDALPVVAEHGEHQRHIAGRLVVRYEQNVLVLAAGHQLQFGLLLFGHRLLQRVHRVQRRTVAVRSDVAFLGLCGKRVGWKANSSIRV